jgi:pimeloyl-ACP methyl ester carboxylesterase
VYALDLLGFGASDKPVLPEGYSIELWAQLLADFAREFALAGGGGGGGGAVFVGNSVGSLVCLAVGDLASFPAPALAIVRL